MNRYKLREALVALSSDAGGYMKIVTSPVDAVLKVATISLQSGMVDVQWEDQAVSVFAQDLKSRGDLPQNGHSSRLEGKRQKTQVCGLHNRQRAC